MIHFPLIYTNIWDTFWAVPVVLVLTQIFKKSFHIPSVYVPTVATFFGLAISILISHHNNFAAGVFMGFYYGGAAVGTYASLKNSFKCFRAKVNSKAFPTTSD